MAFRPSCSCCCLLMPATEPGSGSSGFDVGVADQPGTATSQVSRMATTPVANVRLSFIVCSQVADCRDPLRQCWDAIWNSAGCPPKRCALLSGQILESVNPSCTGAKRRAHFLSPELVAWVHSKLRSTGRRSRGDRRLGVG